jgi:hypothetical protein
MMIESNSNSRSELLELLSGDAMGDLDATEQQRLAELMTEDDKRDAEELRLTAGALQLAFAHPAPEDMPASLRNKIATDAPKHLARATALVPVQPMINANSATTIARREQLAWLTAAASLLFAIGLWVSSQRSPEPEPDSTSIAASATVTSASKAREELIAQASDRIEIAWASGTTPFDKPVSGDVVWSNSRQKGFLRFVGMPVNDPSSQQYQLWIIDPARDANPIDGGVFDVNSEGEVIIPIDAKLTVIDPAAFAVTIEKPGGVVVSDQKRLPLLAKVSDAKG